jgi:protein-arginine kinase activator protein McsA
LLSSGCNFCASADISDINLIEVSSTHSVAKKHLDNLNTKKEKLHNEQRQPIYNIGEDIQKTKETELDNSSAGIL